MSNLFLPQRCLAAHNSFVLPARTSLVLVLLVCAFAPCFPAQEKPWEHSSNAGRSSSELPPEARIDINHAPLDQLLKVPGLTQVWAARIVRFRPYRTKVDLLDRGILPSSVYDRIKGAIIAHHDKPGSSGTQPDTAGKELPKKKPAPRPYKPPSQPSYSW